MMRSKDASKSFMLLCLHTLNWHSLAGPFQKRPYDDSYRQKSDAVTAVRSSSIGAKGRLEGHLICAILCPSLSSPGDPSAVRVARLCQCRHPQTPVTVSTVQKMCAVRAMDDEGTLIQVKILITGWQARDARAVQISRAR
jgi:hypothetical protein